MIVNNQRGVRIRTTALEAYCQRVAKLVKLPAESVTICFVENRDIARWNRAYRGKKGATDVLSFPVQARNGHNARRPRVDSPEFFSAEPRGTAYMGDIAIAPAVAKRNAVRFDRTVDDELRILILHGVLHLLGFDHETDRGEMDRREAWLRRQLGLA
jgi:probable rRNA maturation factor